MSAFPDRGKLGSHYFIIVTDLINLLYNASHCHSHLLLGTQMVFVPNLGLASAPWPLLWVDVLLNCLGSDTHRKGRLYNVHANFSLLKSSHSTQPLLGKELLSLLQPMLSRSGYSAHPGRGLQSHTRPAVHRCPHCTQTHPMAGVAWLEQSLPPSKTVVLQISAFAWCPPILQGSASQTMCPRVRFISCRQPIPFLVISTPPRAAPHSSWCGQSSYPPWVLTL